MDSARPIVLVPGILTLTDSFTATYTSLGTGGPRFGVSLNQKEKESSPQFSAFFEGAVCIDFGGKICFPVMVRGSFPSTFIELTGSYGGGNIRPLAFLPGTLADSAVILANSDKPIGFLFKMDPLGDCRLTLGFAATLHFQMDIIGLDMLLPVSVQACAIGPVALIISAAIPTITLPGDLLFEGLELALSSYPDVETFTLGTGTIVDLPPGISIFWNGPSPLAALCPIEVVLTFSFEDTRNFGFEFVCTGFELTILDRAPLKLPSINFVMFTAIGIFAEVAEANIDFGLTSSFNLATGGSMCASLEDAECLVADLTVGVGLQNGEAIISMDLLLEGAWLEPLGLRNFAIVDPKMAFRVTILPGPAATPNLIAFAITIYYKPDPSNLRNNWPTELTASKADSWPPDLSQYVERGGSVRQCSVYFLYEQWHPALDDLFLGNMGLPRFAMKLRIPYLTLLDVMMMFADIHISMYAASGVDVGGSPPGAASLMSAVNELLTIEMSVVAEISLVESSSVPEWGGHPVKRGLYLNMTAKANFIGFTFDWHLEAKLLLPNPSAAMAEAFGTALEKFFQNPMGVVTGEVDLSALGLEAGITIKAKAVLPFFDNQVDFYGKITFTSFELRASAFFQAGPFLLDASFEILVTPLELQLAFGAEIELGPFGYVSVYGQMSSSPEAFFMLNGTFCRTFFGWFGAEGSTFIDSRTRTFAFEMRGYLGFLGVVEFKGRVEDTPRGVLIQGSATVALTLLDLLLDKLVSVIVKAIAGTEDPDSSIIAKAMKILFLPLRLFKRGAIHYDNQAGSMGMELILDIFGERTLAFSLPAPVRRQLDDELRLQGESMPDWPHPQDNRLNATRRRALSSTCGGPPKTAFGIANIVDPIKYAFGELVAMAERIAPIEQSFEFEAKGMLDFGISGYVRFHLAKSAHITLEMAASFSFIGIVVAGDVTLSTDGGIVQGRLYGSGTTPKLCAACPQLHGALEIEKLPPDKGGHVSLSMEVDISFACFEVEGNAFFDTAGGLRSFFFKATNPMCFVDLLSDAIESILPIDIPLMIKIDSVEIFYSGGGDTLAIDIDVSLRFVRKKIFLVVRTALVTPHHCLPSCPHICVLQIPP